MPGYRTHLATGMICSLGLLVVISYYMPHHLITLEMLPLCIFAALIGSIFPDIDIKSKMQQLFYLTALGICFISIIFGYWQLFCSLGTLALIIPFLYHRTTTHNYKFIILIPMIIPLYISYHQKTFSNNSFLIYLFFVIGALSHIILDRSLTKIKRFFYKK